MASPLGHFSGTARQIFVKHALVVFAHDHPFGFVAFVQERKPECEANRFEYLRILRPGHNGTRAHDGRDVTIHETLTRQISHLDHVGNRLVIRFRAL